MIIRRFVLVAVVVLISNFTSSGQTPSRDGEKGFIPGVPYAVSETGNVNLTNGNLAYSFPLGSLPQGRGTATAGLYLLYNSKLWKKQIEYIPVNGSGTTRQTFLKYDPSGGWNYGMNYTLLVTSRNDGLDEPLQVCNPATGQPNLDAIYVTKVQIGFPDGSKREFWPTGHTIPSTVHGRYFNVKPTGQMTYLSGNCSVSTTQSTAPFMTYYSVDGSYMNLKVYPNSDWELSLPDGSRVTTNSTEGQRVYDRNGNFVRYAYVNLPDGTQAVGWVDQFGRYIARKTTSTEDTIYQLGFNGQLLQTRIRWKKVTVIKKYQTECSDCQATRGQTSTQVAYMVFKVIDTIESPNGLISKFDYHAHDSQVPLDPNGGTTNQNWSPGWGEVRSLIMPSTAKVEYNYQIYTGPFQGSPQINPTNVIERSGRTTQKTLSYDEEYDGVSSPRQEKWLYSSEKTTGGFVGPDGRESSQSFYHLDFDENLGGHVYRSFNPDGSITENQWQFNNPAGFAPGKPVNPYIKAEFHTIRDAGGNPAKTAIKSFTYDKNGNLTRVDEYDWVSYSSLPRDSFGRVNGLPASLSLLRTTDTGYYHSTPTATDSTTLSDNAYWRSSAPKLRSLVAEVEVRDKLGEPQSRNEYVYDYLTYDGGNTKGANPIQTRTWDSFKGGAAKPYSNPLTSTNSVSTSATYNAFGMPVTTTDARGYTVQMTYGDISTPSGIVTDLYPTRTVTAYGTSVARTSVASYDFLSGLATASTDVDNNVSTITEYDMLGRPIKVRAAVGTPSESWTRTEYDDVNRRVVFRSDIDTVGDGRKVSVQHYDEIGRLRLSRTLENVATEDPHNETHGIKVQTRYGYNDPTSSDADDPANTLGEYKLVSNPFRAARSDQASAEESMGWTRSYSDRNGRRTEVQTFAGTSPPAPWGGNANSTGVKTTDVDANSATTTDQAGRQIRNISDARGQLVRVDEPTNAGVLGTTDSPAQPTHYSYSGAGDMIQVVQGSQSRHFMYDSLHRLVRVRQPEQDVNPALATSGNPANNAWSIGYLYDGNGNLLSSRDAKNVVISTVYDPQNRPTTKTYSDSTPSVAFAYDSASVPFSKGQVTKISSTVAEMRYLSYDENGRPRSSEQVIDGRIYPSGFRYNLAGILTEQIYPSGRVVKNFLESDGDLGSIAAKTSSGPFKNYAANFSYTPSGVIKHLQLGNGLWESARLNSRDQVTELNLGNSPTDGSLWKLTYQYGETDSIGNVNGSMNSGNIAKQSIRTPGIQDPLVQTYRYDTRNRIVEAKEVAGTSPTWSQTFGYDRYGNRTARSQIINNQPLPQNHLTLPQIDPNTNRFQTGQGYEYDAAGNLIRDPEGRQFVFNGENKQIEVRDAQNQTVGEYLYDGNGARIKKVTSSGVTVFLYDGLGKLVAEMSTEFATPEPTVNFTATDPLGSPRVITNSRGQVISRRDFMPFGEEIGADSTYRKATLKYGVTDGVRKKFTGYERDEETGLDFAEARYYNNAHGRFTAVDPLHASGKSADPQTFNRYVYVMNRPLMLSDSTGLQAGRRDESLRGILRSELAKPYDLVGGDGSVTLDDGSLERLVVNSLPIMRQQYELSFSAQNALNAQANTQSNQTVSNSTVTTTAPTTVTLEASGSGGSSGKVTTKTVPLVAAEVEAGGSLTTTISPGVATTETRIAAPGSAQEKNQAAAEGLGSLNTKLSGEIERTGGLTGSVTRYNGSDNTASTSTQNINLTNMSDRVRNMLVAADVAGRQHANDVNPLNKRLNQ